MTTMPIQERPKPRDFGELCSVLANASPPALRALFADRGRTLEVAYRPSMCWRVQDSNGTVEITDGESSFVIKDGEVTAYPADHLVIHNRLRSFVMPWKFTRAGYIQQSEQLTPIEDSILLGRKAWVVTVSGLDGKPPCEFEVDALTGMVLRMRAGDDTAAFEVLETDVDFPDNLFVWAGEITDDRRGKNRGREP
jgi:hypothetical protein